MWVLCTSNEKEDELVLHFQNQNKLILKFQNQNKLPLQFQNQNKLLLQFQNQDKLILQFQNQKQNKCVYYTELITVIWKTNLLVQNFFIFLGIG